MTNKDFFLATLKEEVPKFRKVIEALPEDNHGYKVHERSREAGNLAGQLALQWKAISGIVAVGVPSFDPHEMEKLTKGDMVSKFDLGIKELIKDVEKITNEEWEQGKAGFGEVKDSTKYHMAWMFLLDAIHHRGQLATFLRSMGAKVPAIYGPSADEAN